MNKQEIFDKVSRALLAQNRKSLSGQDRASAGVACAFFSEHHEGDRCAIGHLIPDEMKDFVKERANGLSISGLWDKISDSEFRRHWFNSLIQEHETLLYSLQKVHDKAPVENWREALCEVAIVHSLETSILHRTTV